MKEHSILSSGEEVMAILAGRKTQIRRVVKPQPQVDSLMLSPVDYQLIGIMKDGTPVGNRPSKGRWLSCPYGQLGDSLWVRETWQAVHFKEAYEEGFSLGYCDEWHACETIPEDSSDNYWTPVYAATDSLAQDTQEERGFSWRPSVHMPRWASRITLEIVNVRVERLQDITAQDAVAEGWHIDCDWEKHLTGQSFISSTPISVIEYSFLWDSINSSKGHGWITNPWVWVIEFKRVQVGGEG